MLLCSNFFNRRGLHTFTLNETIGKVTENFDKFEFGVAGHILYNFIWDEFASNPISDFDKVVKI